MSALFVLACAGLAFALGQIGMSWAIAGRDIVCVCHCGAVLARQSPGSMRRR
jgi:hypothetical protein